jgi:hypothetical protein
MITDASQILLPTDNAFVEGVTLRANTGAHFKIKTSPDVYALPIRIAPKGIEARTLLLPTHDLSYISLRLAVPAKVSVGFGARLEQVNSSSWRLDEMNAWLRGDPRLSLPAVGATISLHPCGRHQRRAVRKHIKILNLFDIGPRLLWRDADAGVALGFDKVSPKPSACPPTELRIGVVVHLHYTDVWPDIEASLRCVSVPFGLIVTLTAVNVRLENRIKAVFPNAKVTVVHNSGRDVRPFIDLLDDGSLDRFDVVCKIHGKKSLRDGHPTALGDLWRRSALYDLLAGPGRLAQALSCFERDTGLGLLGPERFRIPNHRFSLHDAWSGNRAQTLRMAERLGLPSAIDLDFFAGAMFWVRPAALARLRGAGLGDPQAYAPEAGRTDGAVEHALERLFTTCARAAGFNLGALPPLPDAHCAASSISSAI